MNKLRTMLVLVFLSGMAVAQEFRIDMSNVCPQMTNALVLYSSTNNWITTSVTNYCPDSVEYMQERGSLTNVILQLAEKGYICNVLGHRWESGCKQEGCLVLHVGTIRSCTICRKHETATLEWK